MEVLHQQRLYTVKLFKDICFLESKRFNNVDPMQCAVAANDAK